MFLGITWAECRRLYVNTTRPRNSTKTFSSSVRRTSTASLGWAACSGIKFTTCSRGTSFRGNFDEKKIVISGTEVRFTRPVTNSRMHCNLSTSTLTPGHWWAICTWPSRSGARARKSLSVFSNSRPPIMTPIHTSLSETYGCKHFTNRLKTRRRKRNIRRELCLPTSRQVLTHVLCSRSTIRQDRDGLKNWISVSKM